MSRFGALIAAEALRGDGGLELLVPGRGARVGVVPFAVVGGGDGVDGVAVRQEGKEPEGGDGVDGVVGGHGGMERGCCRDIEGFGTESCGTSNAYTVFVLSGAVGLC